jgi:hypothetical protein
MVIWRRSVRILILAAFAISFDSHARTVSKLDVKGVGLTDESDESTIELCKQFKPTRKPIINFFNKAYPVEAYTPRQNAIHLAMRSARWNLTMATLANGRFSPAGRRLSSSIAGTA